MYIEKAKSCRPGVKESKQEIREIKQELNSVKELAEQLKDAVFGLLAKDKAIEVKQELRGTDAGLSLRSILEHIKSNASNAT